MAKEKAQKTQEQEDSIELRVKLVDADFKKLEAGKPLMFASGQIGNTPITIAIVREKQKRRGE